MTPVGFEPTISAGERAQSYALDRAAVGVGLNIPLLSINKFSFDHSACPVILNTSLKTTGNIADDRLFRRYRFHCMYCITMFAVIYRLTPQAVLHFNYTPAVVNILPQFFLYDLLSSVDHRI